MFAGRDRLGMKSDSLLKLKLAPFVPFQQRASGILLHPTSLPGGHGIGDLGAEARRFADWLHVAGQSYWQMLPICPPGSVHSPYDSPSANAISPLLVSLDDLVEGGLLRASDIHAPPRLCRAKTANFTGAGAFKERALRHAHERFMESSPRKMRQSFERFCLEQANWLDDYALFRAIQKAANGNAWNDWDEGLRDRKKGAIAEVRSRLAAEVDYQKFVQFILDEQWMALRRHCRELGILLMGDIPIYVAYDSADVWANRDLFYLDAQGRRVCVAGVPPDYFSKTGQLWGNPLYRWDALKKRGFGWWKLRMSVTLRRFDAVRLDHFIGFRHYWEVPAAEKTAKNGRYVRVPAEAFFDSLKDHFGALPFLAEDLGVVTDEIHQLRARLGLPGMCILQFAFDDPNGSDYLPHRFVRDTVVYSGTHDNDTLIGWLTQKPPADKAAAARHRAVRDRAIHYAGASKNEVQWEFIRLALGSVANTAIFPIQDVLGLGSDARMNTPATVDSNWLWRLAPGSLRDREAVRLRHLCETFERIPKALIPKV